MDHPIPISTQREWLRTRKFEDMNFPMPDDIREKLRVDHRNQQRIREALKKSRPCKEPVTRNKNNLTQSEIGLLVGIVRVDLNEIERGLANTDPTEELYTEYEAIRLVYSELLGKLRAMWEL